MRRRAERSPSPAAFTSEDVIAAALAGNVEQLRAFLEQHPRQRRWREAAAAHAAQSCGLRLLDAAVLGNSPAVYQAAG
jgi:hypothetical protein